MKCEYCDNPVPNGATRCPSCGAAVQLIEMAGNIILEQMPRAKQPAISTSFVDPYLYVDKKSRVVYVVLAIIFGEIGVHNFYAGYIGRGVVQLLVTVLTFGLLFWVSWIWAVVEACAVDCDGKGVPFE